MGKSEQGLEGLLMDDSSVTHNYTEGLTSLSETLELFTPDDVSGYHSVWQIVQKAAKRSTERVPELPAETEEFLDSVPVPESSSHRQAMLDLLVSIMPLQDLELVEDRIRVVMGSRMHFIGEMIEDARSDGHFMKALGILVMRNSPTLSESRISTNQIDAMIKKLPGQSVMKDPLLFAGNVMLWAESKAKGDSNPLRLVLAGERFWKSNISDELRDRRAVQDLEVFARPSVETQDLPPINGGRSSPFRTMS